MTYCVGSLIKRTCSDDQDWEFQIEWTVKDILSKSAYFDSPGFTITPRCKWFMRAFPNGDYGVRVVSTGWISLHLYRTGDRSCPKGLKVSFGVRNADGEVEQTGKDIHWMFGCGSTGIGVRRFLKRSELQARFSELAPSNTLTIICRLNVIDSTFDCSSMQDTLSSNLADLFLSKRCCDATLRVQNRHFPVHKIILSARSPVFSAMFEADMREGQTGVVDIVDCDPSVFEDFLAYLYTGRFQNSSENVVELYKIADKYCTDELRSACIFQLMDHLTVDNVCEAVAVVDAKEFGFQFREKIQEFFERNFVKILYTDNWKYLLKTNKHLAYDLLDRMETEKEIVIK